MSKKKKKPYIGRNTWTRKPVTQVVPNKKAYNRKKNRGEDNEDFHSKDKETVCA